MQLVWLADLFQNDMRRQRAGPGRVVETVLGGWRRDRGGSGHHQSLLHIERAHATLRQFVAGSSGTMPRRVATAQSPS